MAALNKRTTVYFDPVVHKALKLLSAETSRSISDIIDEAVRQELLEETEDLKSFKERVNEPTVTFESFMEELKTDGKI